MKAIQIIASLAMVMLVGCVHQEKATYTAPSVVAVRTSVEKLKPLVKPEGQKAISNLETAITSYEVQVDQQARDLAKAQNDVVYWHGKQEKALKELWLWRGIAIASILCVVGYIGIRTAWRFAL
jgi:hypothetical protein